MHCVWKQNVVDSLLFKCFKARYFPWCHFQNVVDSPNSSYVWKGILLAMPILRSVCCWRVGNEESIKVTTNKWIPNYPSNKILHPVHEEEEGWTVSDLIDSNRHWWRWDIIMTTFNREDAEAIFRIPLSRKYVEDSIVWLQNKSGAYSVRSGYHSIRKVMRKDSWAECLRGSGG